MRFRELKEKGLRTAWRDGDQELGNEDQRTGLGLGEDGNEGQRMRVLEVGRAGGLRTGGEGGTAARE